jgi:ATP-dependent DNA ligase
VRVRGTVRTTRRLAPSGFIAPCLPTKTDELPSGGAWLHEIKHDGFRIIARKDGERVRLYSRPGNDFTHRFPLIVETLAGLRARSCVLDGEAVACDHNGIASFDLIRNHRHNHRAFLYAFDLIELNGDDMRREVRKATLRSMLTNRAAVAKRPGQFSTLAFQTDRHPIQGEIGWSAGSLPFLRPMS